MDYQFERNDINQALATFSAGHEAIGHFLSSELQADIAKSQDLLDVIGNIENKLLFSHQFMGQHFRLNLSDSGVEIVGLALAYEAGEELPEGTELYDHEQQAECGLFDFKMLLLDWCSYLSEARE